MKKKKLQNYVINLNDLLGRGSFGEVYRAINEKNNQAVAVKVLRKKDIDRDEYIKNTVFLEIKILQKLNSEHVVKIFDVLETDRNYYIVQELCECDLREWMKRDGKYPVDIATGFLQQLCLGFHELISHGVIHRDVKPQNILIRNKVLKLADFGFAKSVASDYMNKTLVGTPYYMAPQILKRNKYTAKCDIWSLGLIFFELIYGRLPWTGKSEVQLASNISNAQIPFHIDNKVSGQAKDFIKGCLQIDETKRFGWEQIFSHTIFNGKFDNLPCKRGNKAEFVISDLRQKVHVQNIDLERLFQKQGLQEHIKFDKFLQVLGAINPDIDNKDVKYLFDKIDFDHNGSIRLDSIRKVLTEGGINFNCKQMSLPTLKKQQSSFTSTTSLEFEDEDTELWKRITEVIQKLQKRLSSKNYNLFDVHKKYDFNKDDVLDLSEFTKLMLKIDGQLIQDELRLCFKRFDLNNDGTITFQQFYRTLCKINGEPSNLLPSKK